MRQRSGLAIHLADLLKGKEKRKEKEINKRQKWRKQT